jgi:protein-tyrosine phosphatase
MAFSTHVVFICAANINRSPMAAAVFAARIKEHGYACNIESAGYLPAMSGRRASEMWLSVPKARPYDLSEHRSRHMSTLVLTNDSHVVCLDPDVERFCRGLKNLDYRKLRVLSPPEGIFDPIMHGTIDGYDSCLSRIEKGVDDLVAEFCTM